MILEPGIELGEYEILGLLGEGSMGKVYRARDRALGREVALKVLSMEFSRKDEHVARFQREARVLASLNHPNIATIHGLGKVGETSFLVLELIEGDTLAQILVSGRLPFRRALETSLQIANALEAAHVRGIVHRDLKPGNVKVTQGKVKVLDFGIAKFFDDDSPDGETDESAEASDLSTETGVVLGTVGYMSPEQVRGDSIDGRSDVWAFGCLLFELLSGKRAFRGRTPTDTLAQVLDGEPSWKALPPDLPPSIERLVRRCLRKDRRQRLQAIGDARIEMEDALLNGAPIPSSGSSAPWARATLLMATLVIGLVAGYFASRALSRRAEVDLSGGTGRAMRYSFTLEDDEVLPYLGQRSLAAAPDGSRFSYVVMGPDGSTSLRERALDCLESLTVPDTSGAREPFYSPDSKWLGFFAVSGDAHRLERLSIEGGVPVVFHAEPKPPRGGVAWAEGDEIAFAAADGLRVISSNGGAPREIACGDESLGEICRWPEVLPGGKIVLYTVSAPGKSSAENRVVAASLLTGERRTVVEGGSAARYSPTGHLIYAESGDLFAAPFDIESVELTMQPARIASGVLTDPATGAAQFAISNEGTLVFAAGKPLDDESFLRTLDRNGRTDWTSANGFRFRGPFRLSPDGGRIALALEELGKTDVWLYD